MVKKMIIMITALFIFFFLLFVYDYLEITLLKYGVLKAMATQSKDVDRALHEFLETRDDFKILNKQFKKFEKIYLTNLNIYIFKSNNTDSRTLRREILKNKYLEL